MIKSLFPKTKSSVLALFFLNHDKEYYLSEVLKLTGTRQGAIQRELETLSNEGILNAEKRGRHTYYSVNKSNPIYKELQNVVYKTFGLVGRIKEDLKQIREKIKAAFIYGSIATGQETTKSDIDLMIVGKVTFDEVSQVLEKTQKSLGREINFTVFPEKEFKSKLKEKNHFLNSVLETELNFIIGDKNDLRKLAGK